MLQHIWVYQLQGHFCVLKYCGLGYLHVIENAFMLLVIIFAFPAMEFVGKVVTIKLLVFLKIEIPFKVIFCFLFYLVTAIFKSIMSYVS